ncbi:hypothetical protein [Marinicrinis sediminis]|uniref:Carrier domain-containing protein n=1 Tax=Marinicrinis sediminis TaxID=1652465 RepID=A0ABW5R6D4_9BACL
MDRKANISELVYAAIEELNAQWPDEKKLACTRDTVLFGGNEGLDSLELVHLIVTVEMKVEEETQQTITLADEKAMSLRNSPFRSIGTLIDYIADTLEGAE